MRQTFHVTLKSTNAKTGPIPVTTSSRNTCPNTCPLQGAGCYANSGPLALHWNAVSNGTRGIDWSNLCQTIAELPDGQLWRHNQAGDLPHTNGEIDYESMSALVKANIGRRGFAYTHHLPTQRNADLIAACNEEGFTVNLSANNLRQADKLADLNIAPVVVILPANGPRRVTTPKGRIVEQCPATYMDGKTCANCGLCARRDRGVIIGFPAHGTQKRKAEALAA